MNTKIQKISEIFKGGVTKTAIKFMREIFYKLKNLENWQGYTDGSLTFYKEEKGYINAVSAMIAIMVDCINNKRDIDLDAYIANVTLREIRKALMWDLKPDVKKELIAKMGSFEAAVDYYVRSTIEEKAGKDFSDALYFLAAQIPEEQRNIYNAAKHYANLIEYNALRPVLVVENKAEIESKLINEVSRCEAYRYITPELSGIITKLSNARNILRWQGCGATTRCSILAHMLETAIFGWFMAIDQNANGGFPLLVPQQVFAVALLHDFPELWTNDIPSNCKRKIVSGDENLRSASEELEREALASHFYPVFSEDVKAYLKANIMLEDIEDDELHKFIKNADYFAADCECYWMFVNGSRNVLFFNIMSNSLKKPEERTKATYELLEEMVHDVEHNRFLEP